MVIGGGAVGAACARAAALRGLEVAIFEPGPDPAAASPASAGMLAPQIEAGDDVLLALSVRARDMYEPLALRLQESTGITIGFWRPGIASLAFDEVEPGAAPDCAGALFAPEDGALDPQALTRACLADARRLGSTLRAEAVTAVETADGFVTGVVSASGKTASEHVVLAAGVWSPRVSGLPRPLLVEPVRGQMAATTWPATTPRAILYHDHGYVLARAADAVLGSTMERAGFDCRVTNDGLAQIFRGAVRLLPALASQGVAVQRMWAGLRPVTPDGRPIIGPDPEIARLWYAAGHGRNGILLTALTGEVIADLITRGETDVGIEPLRADRFQP